MKNLLIAICFTFLLMPMEHDYWVITLLMDIPDEVYQEIDETHAAMNADDDKQLSQLENRLRPVLSRIHKDRIEQLWSESLY